jgi:hypothetical protein
MTTRRSNRAARRQRAKKTLERMADHATECVDAWKAHHESCLEILDEMASGTYTPQRYFEDVLTLSLDCWGTWFRCICRQEPEDDGTVTERVVEVETVLEIDQRSEMGGPLRMPAFDEPASVATRITLTPSPPPAFPTEKVSLRNVKGGEAWVSLVDFAGVVLAPGDYPVDLKGETLVVRKKQTTEGSLLFGSGNVPRALLADPSLDLADIVGAGLPPNL